MSNVSDFQGIRGPFIHAPVLGELDFQADGLIIFDGGGEIKFAGGYGGGPYAELVKILEEQGRLFCLPAGRLLLPGLIDLHVHAPQFPQLGKCLDLPLEDWLMNYTFPLEARYSDVSFAIQVYSKLVRELIGHGTTTAVYFATIHGESSLKLAECCLEAGQRAFVGKLSMDNPAECPDFYREAGAAAGIAAAEDFILSLRGLAANGKRLVKPVVTPRFLPSCSDEMLLGLGALVAAHNCHVQTHCSESDWEHGYGLRRFGATDTLSLDRFGLLTDRTILAHCNFIDDQDIGRISRAGAGIAHCPLSNVYFSNAAFACRHALDGGVNVGLGSDIAGGPSPSLVSNMQMAIHVSRLLEDGVDHRIAKDVRGRPGARIGALEAFWMATAGGGRALSEPIGLFRPGYRFDAILMDMEQVPLPGMAFNIADPARDAIEQFIYASSPRNLQKVWVDGRLVLDKENQGATVGPG